MVKIVIGLRYGNIFFISKGNETPSPGRLQYESSVLLSQSFMHRAHLDFALLI